MKLTKQLLQAGTCKLSTLLQDYEAIIVKLGQSGVNKKIIGKPLCNKQNSFIGFYVLIAKLPITFKFYFAV